MSQHVHKMSHLITLLVCYYHEYEIPSTLYLFLSFALYFVHHSFSPHANTQTKFNIAKMVTMNKLLLDGMGICMQWKVHNGSHSHSMQTMFSCCILSSCFSVLCRHLNRPQCFFLIWIEMISSAYASVLNEIEHVCWKSNQIDWFTSQLNESKNKHF